VRGEIDSADSDGGVAALAVPELPPMTVFAGALSTNEVRSLGRQAETSSATNGMMRTVRAIEPSVLMITSSNESSPGG
jgi:hypothetical protein